METSILCYLALVILVLVLVAALAMASKEHDETCKVTDEQKAKVKQQRESEKSAAEKRNAKYKSKGSTPRQEYLDSLKKKTSDFQKWRAEMKAQKHKKSFTLYFKDKSGKKTEQRVEKSSAFPRCKNASSMSEKQKKSFHDKVMKAEKELWESRKTKTSSPSDPPKMDAEKAKARSVKSSKFRDFRNKNKGQFKRKYFELHFKGYDGKKTCENGWSTPPCNYPRSQAYLKRVFEKFDKNNAGYTSAKNSTALCEAMGAPDTKYAEFEKHCVTEKRIYEAKVLDFVISLCEETKEECESTKRQQCMPCNKCKPKSSQTPEKAKARRTDQRKQRQVAKASRRKDMQARKEEQKETGNSLTVKKRGQEYHFDLNTYKPCDVNQHQLAQLGKMWDSHDKTGSGTFSDKEFSSFCKSLGLTDPDKKNFGLVDDGKVEFHKFLQFWYNTEHKSKNADGTKSDKYAENKKKHDAGKTLKRKHEQPSQAKKSDSAKYQKHSEEFRKHRAQASKKYAKADKDTLTVHQANEVGTKTSTTYKHSSSSGQNLLAHKAFSEAHGYFTKAWDKCDPSGCGKLSQSQFTKFCETMGMPGKPKNCCSHRVVNFHEASSWYISQGETYTSHVNLKKRLNVEKTKKQQKCQSEKQAKKYKLCSSEEVHRQRSQAKKKWSDRSAKHRATRKTMKSELSKSKSANDIITVTWVKAPSKDTPKIKNTTMYNSPKKSRCRGRKLVSDIQKRQVTSLIYKSGNETGQYSQEELKSYFGGDKVLNSAEYKKLQTHFKDYKVITESDIEAWWLDAFSTTKKKAVPCAPPSPGGKMKKFRTMPTPTKSSPKYMSRKELRSHREKCQIQSQKKLEESRAQRILLKNQCKEQTNNTGIQLFVAKTQSCS